MVDYLKEYQRWVARADDPETRRELERIAGNELEIRARFGAEMQFGTAGLRGIMGAGTARMNAYTVRRATQGLSAYILTRFGEGSVAIAYDSRHNSRAFAQECASVLAANGIKTYIFDRLMPTPILSFAVRELGTRAGIMITASHNPAEYNGYKVYGSDGCQMTVEDTNLVALRIGETDLFEDVQWMPYEKAAEQQRVVNIGKRTVERYYEEVEKQQIHRGICEKHPVKVLYSPLHGAGAEPVVRVLEDVGLEVRVVEEQAQPDGDFPTCPYPNPETYEALALGLERCSELRPDIFIATDPDGDRVGVAFKDEVGYRLMTGNEVGILLLHYIAKGRKENRSLPKNPIAIRSLVSSTMADEVARDNGIEMRVVLTGFKYIGEQILMLEQQGEQDRFIFGFEESCGYLAGSYVRDKDAVVACMLLCEMTSWCRSKNLPPTVMLDQLYKQYGYYRSDVVSVEFGGVDGTETMRAVMDSLYAEPPKAIAGIAVTSVSDYGSGVRRSLTLDVETPLELPVTDMIGYTLESGANILVRPSGTEPKIKIYITVKEDAPEAALEQEGRLKAAAKKLLIR